MLRLNKRILVFLTFACLFACLAALASPTLVGSAGARIDPEVARIVFTVKIRGTGVWHTIMDFVPISDNAATVRLPAFVYTQLIRQIGQTISTPFDGHATLWGLPLEVIVTSTPQPLTIHFAMK